MKKVKLFETFMNEKVSNDEILNLVDDIQSLIQKIKAENSSRGAKLFTAAGPLIKELHSLTESVTEETATDVDEMAETDIHFKAIIQLWSKSDNQGKRRILDAIGYGVHDFESMKKELKDMSYKEIIDVEKALGFEEPEH